MRKKMNDEIIMSHLKVRMTVTFAFDVDDDIDHGDDDGGDGDGHLCSQLILSSSPLSATPLLPPLLMLPSTMLTLLLFLLPLLLTEMFFDEEKLCSSIELVEFKASNMTDLMGANNHHHLFQNQLSPHLINIAKAQRTRWLSSFHKFLHKS